MEETNRLEHELRETLVPEFAGMPPQIGGRAERRQICLKEAARFLRREEGFPGYRISTQTGDKILSEQNFAPALKKHKNISTHYASTRCGISSPLARDLLKGLRLATNKAEMKNQVQEINEPEFEVQVLRSTQPVLVGFLTSWSKPCRLIEPVLDEVAAACNSNPKILKVNVDDNPDLGTIYSIQSVPTLIYFVNGSVRAKIVGMVSPKAIHAKLNLLTPGNMPTGKSERPQ
jgi:thioredoxin 1